MSANRILIATEATDCGLREQFEALGYDAFYVDTSAALEHALTTDRFNVLCLGTSLPGADYERVFQRMATDAELKYIPIVVVADAEHRHSIADFLGMGAHDYLEIPIELPLLKARIESCLGTRHTLNGDQLDIKSALELASDMQRVILPTGFEMTTLRDFGKLQELIVTRAQDLCNADGATLYLVQEKALAFSTIHTRSLNILMGGSSDTPIGFDPLPLYDPETGAPNDHNIATRVALTGKEIHVPDVYHTDEFDFSATHAFDRHNHYRTVSCLALPLKDSEGEVIGVLQLINAQDTRTGDIIPFKINDQLAAEAMAMQAAIAINNYLLLQKEQELIRFETDVQVGRSVQASFLPKSLPTLEGWEIAAQFYPAREVAGDFYDVIDLKRDILGLVIADVCDKGVPAALYMALTRSLLRALSQQNYSLSWADALFTDEQPAGRRGRIDLNVTPLKEGLTRTNNFLVENHSDLTMFATMFFGLLNTHTGQLSYVNCGHNPPVIIDRNCNITHVLKPVGPAVGMMPDMPFTIQKVDLNPGDTLMTFTDGVPEARAPSGAFYTDARLQTFLTSRPVESVATLLDTLVADVQKHISTAVQFDDITMLAVRRELPE